MGGWHLPSTKQLTALPHLLNKKEKLLFGFFFLLFLIASIGLLITLDKKYSISLPYPGGSLKEGIVGNPSMINPLLAISDVDRDLVNLIYAGLMRSDGKGGLKPELASHYEISEDGLIYTFWLREGLAWHDGMPLTADDVIFTIEATKNIGVRSPKRANWEGVEIEKIDANTIQFILKKPYAPFLENTKLGIMPKHLWGKLPSREFNLTELNIKPVGAGPYRIDSLTKGANGVIMGLHLKAFQNYKPEKPLIKKIALLFYSGERDLLAAYKKATITSMNLVPKSGDGLFITNNEALYRTALPQIFGIFFNQSKSSVLADITVRRALEAALDREKIIREVFGGNALAQSTPIFPSGEQGMATTSPKSKEEIIQMLREAGWEKKEDGTFEKKEKKKDPVLLTFTLTTSDNPALVSTAKIVQNVWQDIGIKVDLAIFELGGLEQDIIRPREYEALLFGQVVGFNPDPFAFWHSSQINDPGLNVALYANTKVDRLLEEARTIIDDKERQEKYNAFQKEIIKELPAIFLYSPTYLYLMPDDIHGIDLQRITIGAERFSNIENWYKHTQNIWKIFLE